MALALPWLQELVGFRIDSHGVCSFFLRQFNAT
jgi:hypothetical protein